MINDFLHAIEAFNRLGWQWKVDYIIDFSITLAPFRPAQGSSFSPTPTHIAAKKCVVNVQNRNDELCFLYSILAHIHRVESKQNPSCTYHYRPHLSELVTTGLSFPLAVKDVAKFERLNEDIAVNVMTFDGRQPIPLYVTPHRQRNHVVNLLLLTDDQTNTHHYVLIRDLSRLVRGRTKNGGKAFVCPCCLHCFRREHTLTEHIPQCSVHAPQVVTYPKPEDATLHYTAEHPVPCVLYVDFETFQTPDDSGVAVHEASGLCCVRVSRVDNETFEPFLYSGPDVLTEFYPHVYTEQVAICQIVERRERYDAAHRCGRGALSKRLGLSKLSQ